MTGPAPRGRLDAALLAVEDGSRRVVGVGWATVDLERTAVDLATELGLQPGDVVDAPESVALGARCRIAGSAIGPGDVALVILEPATEGRLARHLARYDEGPAVVWLADGRRQAAATEPARATAGPFGAEVLDTSVDGRPDLLRLIVARAPGTIRS